MCDILLIACPFLLAIIPLLWYRFQHQVQQLKLAQDHLAKEQLQETNALLQELRQERDNLLEAKKEIQWYKGLLQTHQEEKESLLERITFLDAKLHDKQQQKEDLEWFDQKFYLDAPTANGLFLEMGVRQQPSINSVYFAQPIARDKALVRLLHNPDVIRRAEQHYLSILSPVCILQGRLPINLENLQQEPGILHKTPQGWMIDDKINLTW
jgi:hypothetical protein